MTNTVLVQLSFSSPAGKHVHFSKYIDFDAEPRIGECITPFLWGATIFTLRITDVVRVDSTLQAMCRLSSGVILVCDINSRFNPPSSENFQTMCEKFTIEEWEDGLKVGLLL